ncbi:MAG: hypothetical protein EPN97_17605 [Alphaproteobacteria bacterium]|nr:MAG: hypothetical protein EPN97_17605 [Alphaproteobacteria bacterium]
MYLRIFLVIALLAAGARGAAACQYAAQSLDEALKAADTAFLGSITTVENGLAIFSVEKGVKNAKEGATVDVEVQARSKGSCGIDFQPGQRWLFLGPDLPSGSLLLQDEEGRAVAANVELVKQKIGDIPADGSQVLSGTIRDSCAPWDGAAFTIQLDNGVSASVYASLSALDAKDKNSVVAYQANGKQEQGSASIIQCPKTRGDKPEDLPCKSSQGTVGIGFVTPDEVTGQIKTTEGEYHSLYVFHVKRLKDQALCG